jgi:O-acetylserine/cysteine efflux transporter
MLERAAMRLSDMITAVFVVVIWGVGFTLAKAALAGFPPILLMAFRFSLTALLLVWFVKPPVGYMGRIFLISLIGAGLQYSFSFTGLKGLGASTGIVLLQIEPAFAAILAAIFLKDMLGWRRAFGMAIAFTGVVILLGEPAVRDAYVSAILMVIGAFLFASGQVMTKAMGGVVGGFQLTAWIAVFAVPQFIVGTLLFETDHWHHIQNADWVVWTVLVYMGVMMTAVAYGLWYRLVNRYSINLIMPFTLLLPFSTVVSAILILNEPISEWVIIGGLVTISGISIIVVRSNPFRRRGVAPTPT